MNRYGRLLLLETSDRYGEISLANQGQLVAQVKLQETGRNSNDIALKIQQLLLQLSWKATEIEGVIVSAGPGSFTSLRVGVITGKTIAYVVRCSLIGVPTFESIVTQVPLAVTRVHVLSDALQGRVYTQTFENGGSNTFQPVSPLEIKPLSEWQKSLHSEDWITGPGVNVYDAQINPQIQRVPIQSRIASCQGLLAWVLKNDKPPTKPYALEPIYLKGSYAEEKRDETKSTK